MNPTHRRVLQATALFVFGSAVAQAHPGHDGHELTWDFGHLAQFPIATLTCAAVLIVLPLVVSRLARRVRRATQRR